MFGVPDQDASREEEEGRLWAAPSRLLRLLHRDEEDSPWPYGDDPSLVFLLDERVTPRRVRLRDRPMVIALLVSVLLHLTLLWQLRGNSLLEALLSSSARAAGVKNPNDNTPFFEIVEMPKQRAEKPSRPRAPASDFDRRAHGGVGAPALTPGSQGNTPELRVEAPPAPRLQMPAGEQPDERMASREPGRGGEKSGDGASEADRLKASGSGADAVLLPPNEGGGTRQSRGLKGLSALASPGSAGGAMPNRSGGQVDLGPLSFDTEWYDWGPYAAEMLRRIRYHWFIPEIAEMGVPGVVRIHFFIERDGRVTGLEILRDSGHPPMDFAARDAILDASPLPPLPDDLTGVFHEGVTITFYYNTPVPERTGRG